MNWFSFLFIVYWIVKCFEHSTGFSAIEEWLFYQQQHVTDIGLTAKQT